jgi:hypothetical protein
MSPSANSALRDKFFAAQPQTLTPVVTFSAPPTALSEVIAAQYYINANYVSPTANQPGPNNNMVYVFEGGPSIPFQNAPFGSGSVTGSRQQGNATASPAASPFFSEDYVLAYSVGPAVTPKGGQTTYPNTAASVYIPGGVGSGEPMQYFGSALGFVANGVSPTAIQFTFQFVPGTNPSANGAFIGLWNGSVTNPYGTTPTYTAPIPNLQSFGQAIMGGLTLAVGSQYTAALYTSGNPLTVGAAAPTCIAAWLMFTLQAPS